MYRYIYRASRAATNIMYETNFTKLCHTERYRAPKSDWKIPKKMRTSAQTTQKYFHKHDNPHGAQQDSSDFHTFSKFFDVDTNLFWHLCGDRSQYSHADEQSACVGARRASTHFLDRCTITFRFHWEVKSRHKNHDGANQDSVVIHTFLRICRCWRKSLMTCLQK